MGQARGRVGGNVGCNYLAVGEGDKEKNVRLKRDMESKQESRAVFPLFVQIGAEDSLGL